MELRNATRNRRSGCDAVRVRTIANAAAKRYAETGDYAAAVAEVLAGVEWTRPDTA